MKILARNVAKAYQNFPNISNNQFFTPKWDIVQVSG